MKATIEVPQELVDANCTRFGYTGFVNDEGNPAPEGNEQTQEDFIINLAVGYLNREGKDHIVKTAADAAAKDAAAGLKSIEAKKA